jgi:hypothetical protein
MAWSTLLAGELPDADKLLTLFTEVRQLAAYKTADETINNSAVLQDDNELFVAVGASKIYLLNLDIVQSSGTSPDFKFTFTLPSGGSGYLNVFAHAETNVVTTLVGLPTDTFALAGVAANASVKVTGYITTSAAGTVQLQWAQNGNVVSDTIVRKGGTLVLRQIL